MDIKKGMGRRLLKFRQKFYGGIFKNRDPARPQTLTSVPQISISTYTPSTSACNGNFNLSIPSTSAYNDNFDLSTPSTTACNDNFNLSTASTSACNDNLNLSKHSPSTCNDNLNLSTSSTSACNDNSNLSTPLTLACNDNFNLSNPNVENTPGNSTTASQTKVKDETLIITRRTYKNMSPFEIDQDTDSFLRRLFYLLAKIHPNSRTHSEAMIFDFIFNKLSADIQTHILKSPTLRAGNVESLIQFLRTRVGKPADPLYELERLKRHKNKMSWREAILRVEGHINTWLLSVFAQQDEKTRFLLYKREILQFCDAKTTRQLRGKGLLRPNELKYHELCDTLINDFIDIDHDIELSYYNTANSNQSDLYSKSSILCSSKSDQYIMKKLGEDMSNITPSVKKKECSTVLKCSLCRTNEHSFITCPRISWEPRIKEQLFGKFFFSSSLKSKF